MSYQTAITPEVEAQSFAVIERYWSDDKFRRDLDAETTRRRAQANAAIDASIARHRAQQEAGL